MHAAFWADRHFVILNFGGRGRDGAGLTAPLQHVTTEVAAPPAEFVQGLYDETKFLLETVGLFLQRPRNAELEARKMVNEKILRDPQKFGTTTLARVAALVPKGRAASGAKKKMLLQSATECRLTSLAVGEQSPLVASHPLPLAVCSEKGVLDFPTAAEATLAAEAVLAPPFTDVAVVRRDAAERVANADVRVVDLDAFLSFGSMRLRGEKRPWTLFKFILAALVPARAAAADGVAAEPVLHQQLVLVRTNLAGAPPMFSCGETAAETGKSSAKLAEMTGMNKQVVVPTTESPVREQVVSELISGFFSWLVSDHHMLPAGLVIYLDGAAEQATNMALKITKAEAVPVTFDGRGGAMAGMKAAFWVHRLNDRGSMMAGLIQHWHEP